MASTCNCKQTETDIYRLIRTVTDWNGQKQTTSLQNVVSLQWKSDETLFQRSLTYCHPSLSLLNSHSKQYNGNYQKLISSNCWTIADNCCSQRKTSERKLPQIIRILSQNTNFLQFTVNSRKFAFTPKKLFLFNPLPGTAPLLCKYQVPYRRWATSWSIIQFVSFKTRWKRTKPLRPTPELRWRK